MRTLLFILLIFFTQGLCAQTSAKIDSISIKFSQIIQGTWRHSHSFTAETGSDNINKTNYSDTLILNKDSSFLWTTGAQKILGNWYVKAFAKNKSATTYKLYLVSKATPFRTLTPIIVDDKTFTNDVSSSLKNKKFTKVEYYLKVD